MRIEAGRAIGWARAWVEGLLDSIYPVACRLCGRESADGVACVAHRLPDAPPGPRCGWCALALAPAIADGERCPGCRARRPSFGRLVALGDWRASAELRDWVFALKHGGRRDLAQPLAAALVRRLETSPLAGEAREIDVVVPVPLHWTRRIERGYDQARLLAEGVAERMRLELVPALRRVRATGVQGALHSPNRRRNVADAFECDAAMARRLAAGRVWLIDDVCTSGATLDACALALRQGGARRFSALVLARAG